MFLNVLFECFPSSGAGGLVTVQSKGSGKGLEALVARADTTRDSRTRKVQAACPFPPLTLADGSTLRRSLPEEVHTDVACVIGCFYVG